MKRVLKHKVILFALVAVCLLATSSYAGKMFFTYDANGQLTDAVPATTNGVSYSYDPSGNLRHTEGDYVDLDTDPISYDYGTLYIDNTPTPRTITLNNLSLSSVVVNSVTLINNGGGNFAILNSADNCTDATINYSSCTVDVEFFVTTTGSKSATLRFTTNHPVQSTLDVPLTGTGTDVGYITVTPSADQNFGSVYKGFENSVSYKIDNPVYGALVINSIAFANETSPTGHFTTRDSTCGTTVEHQKSCEFDIVFSPLNYGNISADMLINTTSVDSPYGIGISGFGYDPVITTSSPLTQGEVDELYTLNLSVTNGVAPYTWGISNGTLATGLALNTTSGLINGTPTIGGIWDFDMEATDSGGIVAYKSFSHVINGPTTVTVTSGANGAVWNSGALLVSNGTVVMNTTTYASESFDTVPDTGYHLDELLLDGAVANATSITLNPVEKAHIINATFAINTYDIIANLTGYGSVDCTPNPVDHGSNTTCSIIPEAGDELITLSIDNSPESPPVYSYSFTNVIADHNITAVFNSPIAISIPFGSLDNSVYGYGYGDNRHYSVLKAVFNSTGTEDKLLHVAGYDIDNSVELGVYFNGAAEPEGYITGFDNSIGTDNIFWLSGSNIINGTNTVYFIQNSPGDTWGITRLGLYNTGTAFGNITGGDNDHKTGFDLHFPTGGGRIFELAAWDSDADKEIYFNLNGGEFGGMPFGGNNIWSKQYHMYVPFDGVVGDNVLEVRNINSAVNLWGLSLDAMMFEGAELGHFGGAANSVSAGVSYLLPVYGSDRYYNFEFYDADTNNEISIYERGALIANASSTGNNVWNSPMYLWYVEGRTVIVDIANTVGSDEWGVRLNDILDTDQDYLPDNFDPFPNDPWNWGEVLTLPTGTMDNGQYGNDYGSDDHLSQILTTFEYDGTDKLFHVRAYDIDYPQELAVYLNDDTEPLGYITGIDNATGLDNVFWIPASEHKYATNEILIAQAVPGDTWGVDRLGIYEPGVEWGDIANGDTSHASGIDLHIRYKYARLLEVSAWDSDLDDEVNFTLNGEPYSGIPQGIANDVWTSWYQLFMPAEELEDGDNILSIRNVPSYAPWGIKLNALRGGYDSLGYDFGGTLNTMTDGVSLIVPSDWGFAETELEFYDVGLANELSIYMDGAFVANAPVTNATTWESTFSLYHGPDSFGIINVTNINNPPGTEDWGVRISDYNMRYFEPYSIVSAGANHTLVLSDEGTVWAAGHNAHGQIGDGTNIFRLSPVEVSPSSLSNVVSVEAGINHSVALTNAGSVWTWGYNGYGQLGVNSTSNKNSPVQVDIANIVVIEGGWNHTLALDDNGTVWSWGSNADGALGVGSTSPSYSKIPVQVDNTNLTKAIAIEAGINYSVALRSDGTVWSWGPGWSGVMGIGTGGDKLSPVQANFPTGTVITSIAAGNVHTIALDEEGSVWAWGFNASGQLGIGNTTNQFTPVKLTDISNITAIDAHVNITFAVDADGTVWSWGYNAYGQLGDGTTTDRWTPVEVSDITDPSALSAGNYFNVAINQDGSVVDWGFNGYGQLGLGYESMSMSPVQAGITGVNRIETGAFGSFGEVNGTLWSWGRNYEGVLGVGPLFYRYEPMDTGIIANDISAGNFHTAMINSAGEVWTWGSNTYGQLGDGTNFQNTVPGQVSLFANALDVEAGGYHTAVINSDGQVWTWGMNTYGQLGNGTSANSSKPGMVNATMDAVSVSASVNHTAIINSDGKVWTWGKNNYGQLGDGAWTNRYSPLLVNGISNVISLDVGERHTVALTNTGEVWSWGGGGYGQRGDGTTIWSITYPVQAIGISDVVEIAAGRSHTVALSSTGSVWTWGANGNGQLGIGNTMDKSTPVKVPNLSNIISVSTFHEFTMALQDDGTVWAWGNNRYGQLGNITDPKTPTLSEFESIGTIYEISEVPLGSGNINCTPSSVLHGTSSTCDFTPGFNSYLDDVLEDGISVFNSTSIVNGIGQYSLANIVSDREITAIFSLNSYDITVGSIYNGSINCIPSTVLHGNNSVCLITPADGYVLDNLIVDSVSVSNALTYSFANVASAHSISSTFVVPETVSLPLESLDSGQYGYQYGTNSHYDSLNVAFTNESEDKLLHVQGYDVDYLGEIALYLNDSIEPIGFLSDAANTSGTDNIFWINADDMVSGNNNIQFRQIFPGDTWGVTRLGLYNTGAAFGNMSSYGDADQIGGFDLHLKSDSGLIVQLAAWDSDSDEEIFFNLNGESFGGIPSGNNEAWSTYYHLYLTDRQLSASDNVLEVRNTNPTTELWGVKLNDLYSGNIELGHFGGVANVTSDGVAYLLPVYGDDTIYAFEFFDADSDAELDVYEDDVHIVNVSATGNGVWNSILYLGYSDGQTVTVDITNTSGTDEWGVRLHGVYYDDEDNDGIPDVYDLNSETPISLVYNSLESGQYGYGYGDSKHQESVLVTLIGNSTDKLLHVRGYDIDYEGEVAVYLNNSVTPLGYLSGIDNSTGIDNLWWLPTSDLINGTNEVYFIQNTPGETWGVDRLGIYNTGVAFGNMSTYGDTEHPDGFELHFQGDETKLLEIVGWDNISNEEIYFILNDQILGGLPYDGNSVLSYTDIFNLMLPVEYLYSGDNTLLIKNNNQTYWGAKLNAIWPQNKELGNMNGEDMNSIYYLIPALNGFVELEMDYYDNTNVNAILFLFDGIFITATPNTNPDVWDGPLYLYPGPNKLVELKASQSSGWGSPVWGVRIADHKIRPFEPYTTIASGTNHSVVLYDDGTVRASGWNVYGQLGDGTTTDRSSPAQVVNGTGLLSNIVSIDAGENHSIALRDDGSVLTWGYNAFGQLGINTTTISKSPAQVVNETEYLSNIVAIEAGNNHNLALEDDGSVWAWGTNANGALGIGSTSPSKSLIPVQVDNTDLNQAIAIEAGVNFSVALRSDGTVWSWGNGWSGVMGDGGNSDQTSPVQAIFPAGTEIVSIASGGYHTIALEDDGSVWAWGYNYYGQIGNETTMNSNMPVLISGISNVTNIYAGRFSTFAIKSNGSVWAWGMNDYGQLGDETTNDRLSPKLISLSPGYVELGAGVYSTIALAQDGTVDGWGYNGYGQLGTGESSWSLEPDYVDIPDANLIEAGDLHALSLVSGSIWSWGRNSEGQLGNGMTKARQYEPKNTGIIANDITAGKYHSAIINSGGNVWAWGYNQLGQLADGNPANRTTPVQVSGFANAIDVEAGWYHTAIVNSDGTVWTWGYNAHGELGDGSTINNSTPAMVNGITNAIAVSATQHTAIINSVDGTVMTWGRNHRGQLGDGTTDDRSTPLQVSGITNIVSLASGESHIVALTNNGDVLAWGLNLFGQIGDGTTTQRNTPEQTIEISNVIEVAAGRWHTVALTNTGDVWAWGWNKYGQLGIGNTTHMYKPTHVTGLSDIVSVSAAFEYSMALEDDGTVWTWGRNDYGQLGYGTDPLSPAETLFDVTGLP